jgi:hypothetical protein
MEICIYDARGNEIINTTINHGYTIEDLYNRDAHGLDLYRGALRKTYGLPIKTLAPRLTISEVADVLESYGFGKTSAWWNGQAAFVITISQGDLGIGS